MDGDGWGADADNVLLDAVAYGGMGALLRYADDVAELRMPSTDEIRELLDRAETEADEYVDSHDLRYDAREGVARLRAQLGATPDRLATAA